MSTSDDNTKELESYGVWVKKSADSSDASNNNQESPEEIQGEDTLDLPDFDDSDFSDMFKDDFSSEQTKEENFTDDLDTTLSTDELANITGLGDVSVEQVDANEDSQSDSSDFSSLFTKEPDLPELETEEVTTKDIPSDNTTEDSASSDISADDFNIDDSSIDIPSDNSEEVSIDDFSVDSSRK